MKEEIIYLEPDEEITSVIDKLKNSKSSSLALVVPRQATLLQSVVNLKLLLKEAGNLGKAIVLVTADKIGQNLAAQVGLEVYDSIRDRRPAGKFFQPAAPLPKGEEEIVIDMAQKEEETPKPRGVSVHHFQEEVTAKPKEFKPISTSWTKKEPKVKINWHKFDKIIWPVLAVIILLIIVGAFFILPKTKVLLKVDAVDYQKDLDSQIDSKINAEDLTNNIFPGKLIEKTQQKEQKFSATGKKNLGGKASGTLTLYNYWDSNPQSLSSGAKFSSSSKTFVSKSAVTIPGTSIRGGNIVPGTATVDIEAESPGEEYNVKSGRFTIVGLSSAQQEKIYGQSNKDLTGGFSKEVTVVSQDDYNKAKDQLVKEINEDLISGVKSENPETEVLEQAIKETNLETKSSANVDSEASEFTMSVNQKLTVMIFSKPLFDQFILNYLGSQISYDKMISLGKTGSIDLTKIEPQYNENKLKVAVKVNGKISSRVDIGKVKNDLIGKSKSQAENYLNSLSGISGFEFKFWPNFWLKRMPRYASFLEVELQYVENNPQVQSSPAISPQISPSVTSTH